MPQRRALVLVACALIGACDRTPESPQDAAPIPAQPSAGGSVSSAAVAVASVQPARSTPAVAAAPLLGEAIARREWARAANRVNCAPLALANDDGAGGTARRANFSGGWAVAFDLPELRSAYGFAGAGALPDDALGPVEQRQALTAQWPSLRAFDGSHESFPAGSFAGYGLEGAAPYSDANPTGRGQNSVAYLRITGQRCLYNVWSRLGRAHLEAMLDGLRILPAAR